MSAINSTHTVTLKMAQLYVDQGAPSGGALLSSAASTFQSGPILRYLNHVHSQLPTFDSSLNETAIEKELYATENETPSMDLLTCTSALTNSSSISQRSGTATGASSTPQTRSKVESSSGCKWSCTGQYKPALGLGPLADLFSRVIGSSESVLGGVTFNAQLKHSYPPPGQCYESGQHLQSNPQSGQATFVPHHERALNQEPMYSCQFSREYNGTLPPTASYDNSDNYSYGYTQNDFENGYQLTAPFTVAGTVNGNCQLYSTNPEWYSIPPVTIVDNISKYNDNMDIRLNGYTDYSFQQASAGHY